MNNFKIEKIYKLGEKVQQVEQDLILDCRKCVFYEKYCKIKVLDISCNLTTIWRRV